MSVILRKAILPKNVSMLKYFKGRPLVSAANKKHNGVFSTAVPCHRNLKFYKARGLRVGTVKTGRVKPLPPKTEARGACEATPLRFCVSSPDIMPLLRTRFGGSPIISTNYSLLTRRIGSLPNVPCSHIHTSLNDAKAAKGGGPCGPCCPNCCACLPPPCNTPPKCVQYMTGYYYYPYGFWFCGPYHVSGTCVPCGPVNPSNPCGPPCPPPPSCCGSCPCPPPPPPKPKCPCPKCCACLDPTITTAVVGGDPELRYQSAQSQLACPNPRTPDVSYPAPPQALSHRERGPHAPASKGGIAKFFPFSAVPALIPSRSVPHGSVHTCPYSTQPLTQSCPQTQNSDCSGLPLELNSVYCTPCIKARYRPRQPSYFTEKYKKSDYFEKKESRSPIQHKRARRVNCEFCPVLQSPRGLLTKEERDRPTAYPGTFQYSNIPNFRKPFPSQPEKDKDYKEFESNF